MLAFLIRDYFIFKFLFLVNGVFTEGNINKNDILIARIIRVHIGPERMYPDNDNTVVIKIVIINNLGLYL